MSHSLYYQQIKTYLETIISNPQPIILAISGWPDSMYLLYNVQSRWQSQQRDPLLLHLMTCDHNTRENIDSEISMVKKYSKNNSFTSVHYNGEEKSEEKLRTRRHQSFIDYAHKEKSLYILTGHHFDDRIETSLLNMRRGCGIHGMSWLSMTDSHFLEPTVTLVRPLLFMKKNEILTECERLWIPYTIDPTNDDITYSERNMIRHCLHENFNTSWRYRSMNNLYDHIEHTKEKNITVSHEWFYDSKWIFHILLPHKEWYLSSLGYQDWTSDIIYHIYY